jgi:hypothetical protein
LFASVSAIKMRDNAPGDGAEADPNEKPQGDAKPKNEKAKKKEMGPSPDKVSTLDPVINREYTTFYAQTEPRMAAVFYDKSAGVWREEPVMSVSQKPARVQDINCAGVGGTVCDVVKEAVDVKPWPRRTPAPMHKTQYYTGNDGDQFANPDGTLLPQPAYAPITKEQKEPTPDSPAGAAAEKKVVEEEKKAAEPKARPASAPADKPAFIYIARELPNGDFIYQRPDVACRDGQGANSVGSSVCDMIKEAVDVKPWPRRNYEPSGPAHTPQYYHGNEGDIPANADGVINRDGGQTAGFLYKKVDS